MFRTAWMLLVNHWAAAWALALLRDCGQGSVCLLLVWAVCRRAQRLPASVRAWLWWLACLKLTVGLLCVTPPALPILPSAPATPPALLAHLSPVLPVALSRQAASANALRSSGPAMAGSPRIVPTPAITPHAPGLSPLALVWLLWLVGAAVTLGRSARQWQQLQRRLGPLPGGHAPRIIETEAVSAPLVTGLLRPVILLPKSLLSDEERAMALAHERAHLRRGDLWLGLLPALTQTLLFFFPPVRWAVREYHLAREEACDAAALLATGATPRQYAQLLLRFAAPADPAPALGLSTGYRALRRRLTTLPQATRTLSAGTRRLAAAGIVLGLPGVLPWQLTAMLPARVSGGLALRLPDPHTLRYVITDLGTVQGNDTDATGLNDSGLIVGCAETDPPSLFGRALLWDHGQVHSLAALPGETYCRANGINNAEQVIASSYNAYDHDEAFVWKSGQRTILAGLPGFPHSKALGINAAGQVAGYAQTGDYDANRELVAHAALWNPAGRATDLGTLGGDYSAAYDVNDRGQVVGKADTDSAGNTHAFLWQDGHMTDLGTLGGSNSLAVRINNAGQIAGYSDTGDATHAFVWNSGAMRDLGTLPGGTESEAHGLNDRGQIVGESDGTAALWQDGAAADLNRLVQNAAGWDLQDATAINARGQIVGHGLLHGQLHAFLLTPAGQS